MPKTEEKQITCPDCSRTFHGAYAGTGLAAHRRFAHKYQVHKETSSAMRSAGKHVPARSAQGTSYGPRGKHESPVLANIKSAVAQINARLAEIEGALSDIIPQVEELQSETKDLTSQKVILEETQRKLEGNATMTA